MRSVYDIGFRRSKPYVLQFCRSSWFSGQRNAEWKYFKWFFRRAVFCTVLFLMVGFACCNCGIQSFLIYFSRHEKWSCCQFVASSFPLQMLSQHDNFIVRVVIKWNDMNSVTVSQYLHIIRDTWQSAISTINTKGLEIQKTCWSGRKKKSTKLPLHSAFIESWTQRCNLFEINDQDIFKTKF